MKIGNILCVAGVWLLIVGGCCLDSVAIGQVTALLLILAGAALTGLGQLLRTLSKARHRKKEGHRSGRS